MRLKGDLLGWEYVDTGVFEWSSSWSKHLILQVNLLRDEAWSLDGQGNKVEDAWGYVSEWELQAMKVHMFNEELAEILRDV